MDVTSSRGRVSERQAFFSVVQAGLAPWLQRPVVRCDVERVIALRDKIEGTAARLGLRDVVDAGLAAHGVLPDHEHRQRQHIAAQRGALHSMMAHEVIRLLQASVRCLVLKGVAADELWWGGKGVRAGTDIDVWVNDLDAAMNVLAAVQTNGVAEDILPRSAVLRTTRTVPAKIFGVDVNIDVHSSLAGPTMHDTSQAAWARRVHTPSGLPTLSMMDSIVLWASNALREGFHRWQKAAVDLAIMTTHKNAADAFGQAAELAHVVGCASSLRALCGLSSEALAVSFPPMRLPRVRSHIIERMYHASMRGGLITWAGSDDVVRATGHFARYLPRLLADLKS
jgi:hypothetical protein